MDKKKVASEEKAIIIDEHVLSKMDLLIAISWLDYLPDNVLTEEDKDARDKIIKIINHLTRNA